MVSPIGMYAERAEGGAPGYEVSANDEELKDTVNSMSSMDRTRYAMFNVGKDPYTKANPVAPVAPKRVATPSKAPTKTATTAAPAAKPEPAAPAKRPGFFQRLFGR